MVSFSCKPFPGALFVVETLAMLLLKALNILVLRHFGALVPSKVPEASVKSEVWRKSMNFWSATSFSTAAEGIAVARTP
jgi:hypothetical protein